MNSLGVLLRSSSTKAKVGLAGGALATLIVLVLLVRLATAPSYEMLLTGVDPAQAGKVTRALDEQGITYELQNGGTAVAVQPEQTAQARIALAEQGLPGPGQPGFELFDKQKLGTSDFQQQVNYQRALEGEIAKTIEQVQGVSGAQVQLVLPEDGLFAEDRKPATAAVLLGGSSDALDPGAVRGMAQLVSSSVEGLALDKVTITDGMGRLLWPREGADAAGGSALAKQGAEQRYDQALESQLTALLTRTLGPDKAQVQVQSQLNVNRAKERTLTYDRRGTPVRRKTADEQLRGNGGGAGGRAGTAGNIPGYAAGGAGGGRTRYDREDEEIEYGVGRTVRDEEFAPGEVEALNVAVVVDATVPPATARQLEEVIASAAGVDEARGDTLTVNQVAFAKPPPPEKPPVVAGIVDYLKWALLALGVLLFLFFVTRHLRKRERESLDEPLWLREVTGPQTLAALEAEAPMPLLPAAATNGVKKRAEELAAKHPDKVAAQLRQWMQEGAA